MTNIDFNSTEWLALREIILERDGKACARCGIKTKLSIHHIKPRSTGGTDELYNLITLCQPCHDLVELEPTELFIKSKVRKIQRAYYNRQRGSFTIKLPDIKLKHKGSILHRYFKAHPLTDKERALYIASGTYSRKIQQAAEEWYKSL